MRRRIYSLPRDRSLQAFKDWMLGISHPLNPNLKNATLTKPWIDEAGWVANWRAFWAKVDGTHKRHRPSEE